MKKVFWNFGDSSCIEANFEDVIFTKSICSLPRFRLNNGGQKEARDQVNLYVASARRRIALEAAARAWKHGVPWAEAIKICSRAVAKAKPKAKAAPKGAPARRLRA